MCLAMPLKIIEIEGKWAVGTAEGLEQRLRIDFVPDIKPGEYVMVHVGFAIQKLDESLAMEELAIFREAARE